MMATVPFADAQSNNIYHEPSTADARKRSDVCVRESSIENAGNGVWTTKYGSFQVGEYVTQYSGKFISQEQYNKGEYDRCYTMKCKASFDEPYFCGIDRVTIGEGFGSFVNREAHKKNVVYCFDCETQTIWLKAIKYIGPSTELFTTYGASFRVV